MRACLHGPSASTAEHYMNTIQCIEAMLHGEFWVSECLPRNPLYLVELHYPQHYQAGFENHTVVALTRNLRGA